MFMNTLCKNPLKGAPTCPCSWRRTLAGARRERTSPTTAAWNAQQATCKSTQSSLTRLTQPTHLSELYGDHMSAAVHKKQLFTIT